MTNKFIDMSQRIVFVDWLRVIACFMVICVHSSEPFYLGGDGTEILNNTNALWSTLFDSAMRASVPLFVIASSYLLFPLQKSTTAFLKRRFHRVALPFFVWVAILGVIYALQNDCDFVAAFKPYLFGFNPYWGHLWFIYMIAGVYLLMPMLSPWAEKVSRKGELTFLVLWLFTTLVPFFRQMSIALTGSNELWGEANWNEFGMLYYFSGFVGYLVMGHYFKKWVPELSWKRTLLVAVPLWIVGYAITAGWFWAVMPHDYPVNAPIGLAVYMEQSWRFPSFGVALTVIGYFLVIRKITYSGAFYNRILLPLSKASYGTYLMHMIFVVLYCGLFRPIVSTGECILLTAVATFATASLLSVLCSKIPVIGEYISGYKS